MFGVGQRTSKCGGDSHLLTSDPSLKAMEVGICPADRGVMGNLVRQIDSYTGSDLVVATPRTRAVRQKGQQNPADGKVSILELLEERLTVKRSSTNLSITAECDTSINPASSERICRMESLISTMRCSISCAPESGKFDKTPGCELHGGTNLIEAGSHLVLVDLVCGVIFSITPISMILVQRFAQFDRA